MSSLPLFLGCLVVATFVLLQCSAQTSPLGVNDEEREKCNEQAGEREIDSIEKRRPNDCRALCKYTDGSEDWIISREGQRCCDVGVVYTGRCKNGECPMGSRK